MRRRKFLKGSAAMIGGFPFLHLDGLKLLGGGFPMEEEVFTFEVGQIRCTVFRDLMFKYQAKDYFINASPEELEPSLRRYHVTPDNIPSPFIAVLLQLGDKKILIDTGMGFSEKPLVFRGNPYVIKGRLHHLLHQEKIKGEDITDVIITHFHPDHIGGLFTEQGKLNFPNARFHTHEDEWAYWHSSLSGNQPALFRYFIEKNITPLKNLNLNLLRGDFADVLPGITAVKAEGHTPGQIAINIHSGKNHLLYISDAFLHPLHMERLDWQTNYDLDHQKARQSRVKLLELAHRDDMLINAFHFSFPGLGRIDKSGSGWVWGYTGK
ncbi:MBL fold metallo-hydrolase [Rufibacter hautae]|uniref:MBL fold metallo-hydrolase n=1 Tax=Rufibacter hautae TaxID=2595005 RepID=A0A5B6TBW0_9BACT|nr:MBL fold metallo-hydrolase [Rufibacter hautae]KAA3437658.1 MBL fold metallo-hydrolase [Rufibacter hautae]